MKIFLTVDSLDSTCGGPSRSVPALAQALVDLGARLELWTLEGRHVERVNVRTFPSSVALASAMKQLDADAAVVHDNGLWRPFNWLVCRTARRFRLPYVISPRGMLEPWSLRQSPWKKRVAWYWYQRSLMQGASLLHATGAPEAQTVRRMFLRKPIVVQPNGIEIRHTVAERGSPSGTVLFLSRLHEVKGIEMLFEEWSTLRPNGWRLRVAGTGDPRYVGSLKARAAQLGIAGQIEWLGELDDKQKWCAFESADLFVLPSFSENFGIVVAESLAAGVPVITTTATPWKDLEMQDCGRCVPPEPAAIRVALQEMLQLPHSQRVAMGARGREWMERAFAWPKIAESMLAAYEAALTGRGLERYL